MNDEEGNSKLKEAFASLLLASYARKNNVSLRDLGIIDSRRERTIREREVPFSSYFTYRRPKP